jgi:membrane protease subunit (stomatin/prohibitin family)
MAALDIIKFDGFSDGRAWVAYKYPGDQFLLGSQLIVNPGQEAVFLKGGEICDVFTSGTHTLQTGNLPILNKLVKLPFGGKTPFTAEIFFVNKSAKLDMTWGTATPFQLEDPKYGIIVSIRAHGKYGIKITNSSLFIGEMIGSAPSDAVFSHSLVNSYFNSMLISYIKSTISSFMIKGRISFLDVTAYLTELSKECNELVAKEFERYGIEIINLCIETISPPPSDYESLKTMKEKYAMGERIYVQERKFDLLDKLADNPSNPAVSMGAGMGVGLSAAKEMVGAFREVMNDEGAGSAQPVANVSNAAVCPQCSSSVPLGQKFCGECGAKMEKKCPTCGSIWDVAQKFCGECGTKL